MKRSTKLRTRVPRPVPTRSRRAELASLAMRLYNLRHACLSTWLNGGVYPTQIAEWAGHSDLHLTTVGRTQPPRSTTERDHESPVSSQVRRAKPRISNGEAGGARTHDRRIMRSSMAGPSQFARVRRGRQRSTRAGPNNPGPWRTATRTATETTPASGPARLAGYRLLAICWQRGR